MKKKHLRMLLSVINFIKYSLITYNLQIMSGGMLVFIGDTEEKLNQTTKKRYFLKMKIYFFALTSYRVLIVTKYESIRVRIFYS